MIARFGKLAGTQRWSEYVNFPNCPAEICEKMEIIKFDIMYHNVRLLHFKHDDGVLFVMNVNFGEVDIVNVDGVIESSYKYPNIDAGIFYCMKGNDREN